MGRTLATSVPTVCRERASFWPRNGDFSHCACFFFFFAAVTHRDQNVSSRTRISYQRACFTQQPKETEVKGPVKR